MQQKREAAKYYLLTVYARKNRLTLSTPTTLRLYTLPYWSSPLFLIFDIRALWRSGLSTLEELTLKGLTLICHNRNDEIKYI